MRLNQPYGKHSLLNHALHAHLLPGQTGGYNHEARDRDSPFTAKEEPATMPRVEELIIITELSPWCTIIKNPQGVTLGDVCQTLFKECVSRSPYPIPRPPSSVFRLPRARAARSPVMSGYGTGMLTSCAG